MKSFPMTPLDAWIARKIGLAAEAPLTAEALARYQVAKLNATIAFAFAGSPFYRRRLGDREPAPLSTAAEIARLPFTTPDDLRRDPDRFLSVSRDAVERVVTLETSGTTDKPKRIFFTSYDLEQTLDFFHHGMSTLVMPGQRVLILMPGQRPGSVGDLLQKALARMEVTGMVHGPLGDPAAAVEVILKERVDCLVGLPAQVMRLARCGPGAAIPPGRITSVLLSADYVPESIVSALEMIWQCKVYQHYGMTESGYGGGVECAVRNGYHLREADLFYEIVDPQEGRPLPDGQVGEVVFTTLTRRGMPLIRYRTGDLAAFMPTACPCGSVLRRMQPVRGRIGHNLVMDALCQIALADLDEAIFALAEVMDFQAIVRNTGGQTRLALRVDAAPASAGSAASAGVPDAGADIKAKVLAAAHSIDSVRTAVAAGRLRIDEVELAPLSPTTNTAIKRRFIFAQEGG
jgi:phenylacetate-coenzyme A ligase PaaK-like adenylate-forming protein